MGVARHIVNFSGGKDSTAMLLMMLEKNIPIDDVIFCDTGMEFPEMLEHIKKVEEYIGREITTLKAAQGDFKYFMFEHKKTKGKHQERLGYGWPTASVRWCTGFLKRDVVNEFLHKKYPKEKCINYIGIAYDEFPRIKNKSQWYLSTRRYPLIDWRVREKQALEYCYFKGFHWSGLYEKYDRLSCWCCPLQSLKELKMLYLHFPDLWECLKEMDGRSFNSFRVDYTLTELEDRFKEEEKARREKEKRSLF